MKNITDIDSNFKVQSDLEKDDIKFYNCLRSPFKVNGVFKENGKFRRLPEKAASSISEGVYSLHTHTAGGRVRFRTNSEYVAVAADMSQLCRMQHFAFTGSMGLDIYADNEYACTYVPPYDLEGRYEGLVNFDTREFREITINFPLYSGVDEMYIGLSESATIEEPAPFKSEKPFVYYGSSITQGGCASRPGMSYQSMISRRFNYDYINLGFSGSAVAEDEMIEYIANLDMSLFVCDYDYNSTSPEHLRNTHEKLYKAVREANPDLPIIIMSRPRFTLRKDEEERLNIIKTTYNNAIAAGDKNVYLIDNKMLTELCKADGTVDNCHPNDFGFVSMAKAVGDVIENIPGI